MTTANPQKVLSLLNERLAPHGVKCRDMTLVVANDPSAQQKVCQNLEAHLDRAAIFFNASDHLNKFLTIFGGGPGAQWIFMHNDNYYCPSAGTSLSLDQQIDNAVKTVTGTDEMCAICLEQFDIDKGDISEIGCGHRFHHECLSPVIGRPNTSWSCPLCRAEFRVSVYSFLRGGG